MRSTAASASFARFSAMLARFSAADDSSARLAIRASAFLSRSLSTTLGLTLCHFRALDARFGEPHLFRGIGCEALSAGHHISGPILGAFDAFRYFRHQF